MGKLSLGSIGGIAGGAFGGPVGAMIGSSIGGGLDADRQSRREGSRTRKQNALIRSDLEPYRTAGTNALGAYTNALGINQGFTPMSYEEWSAQNPVKDAGGSWQWQGGKTGDNVWVPNESTGGTQEGYQNYLNANPATAAGTGPSYNTDLPQFNQAEYQKGGDFSFNLEGDQGYQFALEEAMKQANRGMASQGGFNSGNRLAALTDRAAGVASQYANDAFNRQFATNRENYGRGLTDYGIRDQRSKDLFNIASSQEKDLYGREQNYLNQLSNLAGSGQNAAVQTGGFGAQATNAINASDRWGAESMNNMLQGGLSNYLLYDYLNNPPIPGAGSAGIGPTIR